MRTAKPIALLTHSVLAAMLAEFGVYLISDNTNRPYRCTKREPGFAHLQGSDFMDILQSQPWPAGSLLSAILCIFSNITQAC